MGKQQVFEPGFGPGAMGYLAPPRFRDEALSAWLVRIAHAHYLTLEELLNLTGLCWHRLEKGDPQHLRSLSTMLGTTVDTPKRRLWRVRNPRRESPAYYWVACPICLDGDVAHNRVPYIRSGWSDPFATYCVEHDMPLTPQATQDPFGQMFCETTDMFDGRVYRYLKDLDEHDMAALHAFTLNVSGATRKSTGQLTREVCDVGAALTLPVWRGFPYSVVHYLNTCSGRRSILSHSTDFEPDTVWRSGAPGRLGLLRAALSLLECPARLREEGASISDPLLFLTKALSPEHLRLVTERSVAWRPPTRMRWERSLAVTGAVAAVNRSVGTQTRR